MTETGTAPELVVRVLAAPRGAAMRICERCGGDGRIRAGVVLRVLCRNCD